MKAQQSRIGLLSCSLLLTSCLSSRSWTSFVLVLPPGLLDDSFKLYYPERGGDKTTTLSLSGTEVFVLQEHNPLPDPIEFVLIASRYAIREEEVVLPGKVFFRQARGFVSSRPPRVLGAGGKNRKKQIRPRRR